MSNKCPTCTQRRSDCFAFVYGQCAILSDSDFKGKDCPFYKTKKQCTAERRRNRERLDQQGLGYLLDKYGG